MFIIQSSLLFIEFLKWNTFDVLVGWWCLWKFFIFSHSFLPVRWLLLSILTCRMVVSVSSWISTNSASFSIISEILLNRFMVDLCFTCVALALLAFKLPWYPSTISKAIWFLFLCIYLKRASFLQYFPPSNQTV